MSSKGSSSECSIIAYKSVQQKVKNVPVFVWSLYLFPCLSFYLRSFLSFNLSFLSPKLSSLLA